MITSLFLNLIFDAVSYLLNKLDTVSTSNPFLTAVSTVSGYISALYHFMPVITVSALAIVAFDVAFEGGYLFFKVVYWVIRRFPTQS
jgi:hypothetical protein